MMLTPTHFGRVEIHEAPHGINVVVDTDRTVYIGRFDKTNGFEVVMHDCAVQPIRPGEDPEEFVRETARYGVRVDHKDVTFPASIVKRVRILGDIPR